VHTALTQDRIAAAMRRGFQTRHAELDLSGLLEGLDPNGR
jgi:hypothetical protein